MALTWLGGMWLFTAAAVEVRSEPASLVLGQDKSAQITIVVPPPPAPSAPAKGAKEKPAAPAAPEVSLSVNIGKVSATKAQGDGRFVATYTPPQKTYPQIALFLAEVKYGQAGSQRGWFALPLHGKETLPLETKPQADVEVTVAGKVFGPVRASKTGAVKVPIVVPPGIQNAEVKSVDRAGNVKNTTVPLDPPPFQRVRIAVLAAPRASWADAAPLPIELFAVSPEGGPAAAGDLALTATHGKLAALSAAGTGVYATSYRAPSALDSDVAELRIAPKGDPEGGDRARIELSPGPPTKIELELDRKEIRAGDNTPIAIRTRALDGKGNVLPAKPSLSVEIGTLTPVEGGATLVLPSDAGGRTSIAVDASLGSLKQRVTIAFKAGEANRAEIRVGLGVVRAGNFPLGGHVRVTDRFGNPVNGLTLKVGKPIASTKPLRGEGKGRYGLSYPIPESMPPGETTLEVGSSDGSVGATQKITVLPHHKPMGFTLGGFVDFTTNFTRAHSFAASLHIASRIWTLPLEIYFEAGGRIYLPITNPVGANTTLSAQVIGLPLVGGLRGNLPVSLRWALHTTLFAGAFLSWTRVGLTGFSFRQRAYEATPLFGLGAGASVQVGKGRLMAELHGMVILNAADVRGNVGGMGVRLGYLYDFR